jgi:hypothetical protein
MTLPLPSVPKFDWVRALSSQPAASITRSEHHVALALAGYLNAAGHGWVTQARLAADCRLSERTICSALTSLVKGGWLLRESGKNGKATNYWTRVPAGAAATRQPRKGRSPAEVQEYLKVIATACGLERIEEIEGSDALKRLTGSLAHILRNLDDRPDDARRLFERLAEGPLNTAHDPAAVLLHRLGIILRADRTLLPGAGQGSPAAGRHVLEQAIADVTASMTRRRVEPWPEAAVDDGYDNLDSGIHSAR